MIGRHTSHYSTHCVHNTSQLQPLAFCQTDCDRLRRYSLGRCLFRWSGWSSNGQRESVGRTCPRPHRDKLSSRLVLRQLAFCRRPEILCLSFLRHNRPSESNRSGGRMPRHPWWWCAQFPRLLTWRLWWSRRPLSSGPCRLESRPCHHLPLELLLRKHLTDSRSQHTMCLRRYF